MESKTVRMIIEEINEVKKNIDNYSTCLKALRSCDNWKKGIETDGRDAVKMCYAQFNAETKKLEDLYNIKVM